MRVLLLSFCFLIIFQNGLVSADTRRPPKVRMTSAAIKFVRTPRSRFKVVKGFPYRPRYVNVSGLRMAYVQTGAARKGTILLLHGEPTWGYLYRKMIPILVKAGYRIIAPDLIGFGRSDKPTERSSYTADTHISWMKEFINSLGLRRMHMFLHDWGGIIGLNIAAEEPHLFDRLILANTMLPNGTSIPGFDAWVNFSQTVQPFDPSFFINAGSNLRNLTADDIAAYKAPFPSELYMAGVRQFPLLVPLRPDAPGVQRFSRNRQKLRSWTRPVLLQWALKDLGLGNFRRDFRALIPGTEQQTHAYYPEANHFIQEDVGPLVSASVAHWLSGNADTNYACVRV